MNRVKTAVIAVGYSIQGVTNVFAVRSRLLDSPDPDTDTAKIMGATLRDWSADREELFPWTMIPLML